MKPLDKPIIPHLWFDKQAKEAAQFYTSILPDSRVKGVQTLKDTPSGEVDVVTFELAGQPFMGISAGPLFKLNPSVSFFLNFDPSKDEKAREALAATWEKLIDGGKALMPLQKYPFSDLYGWVQDKYGLSWQLILSDPTGEERPFIVPSLLFVKEACGQAEAAIDFYTSVFADSRRGRTARYPAGMAPDKEGTLMFADFQLGGQWFAAMDSAGPHNFNFNEAISLMVYCRDQAEIDYYWQKLTEGGKAQVCGWLKDKFGLSWQVVPVAMDEMMSSGTPEQIGRVTQAFLKMKKFDLVALQKAFAGK